MNAVAVTFDVSDVARATEPLPEVPYPQAVNDLLGESARNRARLLDDLREQVTWAEEREQGAQWVAEVLSPQDRLRPDPGAVDRLKAERARVEAVGSGHRSGPVEACSRYHGRLVAGVQTHPLLAALHRAFAQHRPVCLSPDMVWLLVCQGVAGHVNAHAEELRPRFVRHQGKARIVVRRDDFAKGSPENPWGEVIDAFAAQVRDHVGPAHDLFVPRFSTTGPVERVAAEVVLLDAVQTYFEYAFLSACGIPAVTLEGTTDDWRELADRVKGFADFGLDWWLTPLGPILDEFVAAAGGSPRREFWQSMFKYRSMSGRGPIATGWVTAFFPYLSDGRGGPMRANPWLRGGGERLAKLLAGGEDKHRPDGPGLGEFPDGLARAPFVWQYLDRDFEMEFVGGFVGVAQDAATLTLRPEIGWAVRPAAPA